MKIISAILAVSLLAGALYAAPLNREAPANTNTITCGNVAQGAWTQIPATNKAGRLSLFVSNPTTTTFVGTTDSSLVATSSTTAPITIGPKTNVELLFDDSINTYFRANDSVNGALCVDEQTYR